MITRDQIEQASRPACFKLMQELGIPPDEQEAFFQVRVTQVFRDELRKNLPTKDQQGRAND